MNFQSIRHELAAGCCSKVRNRRSRPWWDILVELDDISLDDLIARAKDIGGGNGLEDAVLIPNFYTAQQRAAKEAILYPHSTQKKSSCRKQRGTRDNSASNASFLGLSFQLDSSTRACRSCPEICRKYLSRMVPLLPLSSTTASRSAMNFSGKPTQMRHAFPLPGSWTPDRGPAPSSSRRGTPLPGAKSTGCLPRTRPAGSSMRIDSTVSAD